MGLEISFGPLGQRSCSRKLGVRFAKRVSRLAPAWRRRIGVALCATFIAVDGKRPLQLIWRGGGEVDGCAHWSRTFRFPIKSSNRALSRKTSAAFPGFCFGGFRRRTPGPLRPRR
jgi:hypothetical protein